MKNVRHVTPPKPARPPARAPGSRPTIPLLTRAIIRSRFPGDTGAARLRQLSLVILILAEYARRKPPTITSLAEQVDAPRPNVDALCNTLIARGILSKTHAPGYQPAGLGYAQSNHVLDVRPDAIEAFQKVHLRETKKRLDLD
jgi:hypothetical protein